VTAKKKAPVPEEETDAFVVSWYQAIQLSERRCTLNFKDDYLFKLNLSVNK